MIEQKSKALVKFDPSSTRRRDLAFTRRARIDCTTGTPVGPFVSIFKNRMPGEGAGPARFALPLGMRFDFLDGKTKGAERRYVYLVSAPQDKVACSGQIRNTTFR
jgi:hypothetical protein